MLSILYINVSVKTLQVVMGMILLSVLPTVYSTKQEQFLTKPFTKFFKTAKCDENDVYLNTLVVWTVSRHCFFNNVVSKILK